MYLRSFSDKEKSNPNAFDVATTKSAIKIVVERAIFALFNFSHFAEVAMFFSQLPHRPGDGFVSEIP